MNKIETIISILKGMDDEDVINLWNKYAESKNRLEHIIYENDESFFQAKFGTDIFEAVRAVCRGEYSYRDAYVRIKNGSLISYNTAIGAVVDVVNYKQLADYIAETDADNFNQVWIEDLIYEFCIYAGESIIGLYLNEQFDFGDFNFVTGDWNAYLTEIDEKIK